VRWPWTRRTSEQSAAPAAPADPPPSPMGWAFLPPLQRTLDTPIEPVTRPTAFPADLPAWRSPAFTGALSHAVVDTMPGGVIDGDGDGVGTPTRTIGPAPELTLLPPPRPTAVQRSVAAEPTAVEPAPAPVVASEEPEQPVVPIEAVDTGQPVEPVESAASSVTDVVRPEPPAATLTRASANGLPLVQRSVVPDLPSPAPQPPPPRSTAEAVVDVVPTDLPARPPLGPEPSRDESLRPVVQRTAAASAPRPTPMATPTSTPPARPRLGLGPPLSTPPVTATPEPPDVRESGGLPLLAEREADQGFTEVPIQRSRARAEPVSPLVPPPAPGLALAGPPEPRAPIQRSRATSDRAAEQPAAEEPADVPRADEAIAVEPPSTPATALPSTPLPLAGGIATSIQRADLLPGPGAPTPSLIVRPAPLIPANPGAARRERIVPIQRILAESVHLPAGSAPGRRDLQSAASTQVRSPVQRAASSGATPTVQRTAPLTSPAPSPPAAGRAPALPEVSVAAPVRSPVGPAIEDEPAVIITDLTPGPTVSRAVASPRPRAMAVPTISRAIAPAPTAPAVAAPAAAAPAVAAPTALPLAVPPPPTPVAVQTAREDVEAPAAGTGGAGTGGPVTVQTAPAAAPPPAAPAGAPAAPAGASGAAPGGGSATGDVDALAQKVFPGVLRRIKAELLLDRERRGVRTDPW